MSKLLSQILWPLTLLGMVVPAGAGDAAFQPAERLRRPVALVALETDVYVANRGSGSISIVRRDTQAVVGEETVGGRLSDLVSLPGGAALLALDEERHQLILLARADSGLRVVQRLDVPHSPVSVEVSADGKLCSVMSLWSRRMTLVDLVSESTKGSGPLVDDRLPAQRSDAATGTFPIAKGQTPSLVIRRTLDLPFAPRTQHFAEDDRRLIVADAFGGQLAVVDVLSGSLLNRQAVSGHNIRGLAAAHDGKELHVVHQLLDPQSATDHEHVFWGGVMKNFVRSVPFDELFAETSESAAIEGSTYPLGHPSGATGDPGPMLVTSGGAAALVLSGIGEIALRRRPRQPFVRRKVGRRPLALCASPDERTLYIANAFDDSISVVDLPTLQVTGTISLGPQPQLTPAERGELAFYDARLSLDGWYSCHSCHTDGHTNGLLNDNFGDEHYGDPKLVPSLLGSGRTDPWAWNGKSHALEQQITKSITVTMQGERPAEQTIGDLAAYLKTLAPPPGLAAARGTADDDKAAAGRLIFRERGCANCHAGPAYTSEGVFDVGLSDKAGNREFNPPSLLGVSQRGPYFHDGRAATLKVVLVDHRHNLEQPLNEAELEALLAFLQSL